MRTQEEAWKKELKGKDLNDKELIAAMAENPKLIHRPIVVNGNKAILAQPPEELEKVL